jgi:hypothetical protein
MGFLDNLKNIFYGNNSGLEQRFDAFIKEVFVELRTHDNYWSIKPNELKVFNEKILTVSHEEKILFVIYCIKEIKKVKLPDSISERGDWELIGIQADCYRYLLEKGIKFQEEDFETIFSVFKKYKD